MRLVFLAPPFNTSARALYETLCTMDGIEQSEYIPSLNQLINHLRNPIGLSSIGVLWPADRNELSNLRTTDYLLRDMRIILILPDHRQDTISEGHLLRPRFVSYADNDPNDIVAVMAKMISAQQQPDLRIAT